MQRMKPRQWEMNCLCRAFIPCLVEISKSEHEEAVSGICITKERFLQALSTVRGNQRVVSDNPEATYDTLNKYGEDLVEKARNQKLDPVIGRDEEIRNIIRILSVRPRTIRCSSVSLV